MREMQAAATRAGERAGWDERSLAVAGRRIRLRFAGAALLEEYSSRRWRTWRPHRRRSRTSKVLLWDSRSTKVGLPEIPWRREDVGPLGEVEAATTSACAPR